MSTDFSPIPQRKQRKRRERSSAPANASTSAGVQAEQFCLPALDVAGVQLVFYEHLSGEALPERVLALVLTWVSIRERAERLAASVRAATGAPPDEAAWQDIAQRQRDVFYALIERCPDRSAFVARARAGFLSRHPSPAVERLVHLAVRARR